MATQSNHFEAEPLTNATQKPRRQWRRFFFMVVLPVFAAMVGVVIYMHGGRFAETDNAYVKEDVVPVSVEVSGTVSHVWVNENQSVKAGQLLFSLDPEQFKLAVARDKAKLAQVKTDLVAMKASFREKQAEITLAHTKYDFSLKNQQRQSNLAARNFISTSRLDEARENTDLAKQEIDALEHDLSRIAETLGGSVDLPVEHHPSYRSALAQLQQAQLELTRTEVRAPLPGNVNEVPKPGQYLNAGKTAMALVVNGITWVEANLTETDLTYVHAGEPVLVSIDTYPGMKWHGVVDSLSPATGAEFSVIPAQNATGNWVKVVQRVPVRIKLEEDPQLPRLRSGLSAHVSIDTGHRRRLFGLSF